MKIHGLPNSFWIVTRPNRVSELKDICFACTFRQLMKRSRSDLHEQDIAGIFTDEAGARRFAMKLLGKNIVRTSDSVIIEVVVNVLMMPTKRNMTAKVLSKAAVEAVTNAVRKAEEEGLRHRLGKQIEIGVGEVVVQNHQMLIG